MCYTQYIQVVYFDSEDEKFVVDFDYNLSTRSFEYGIVYDREMQTIDIEYETDDLTPECYCENQAYQEEDPFSLQELEQKKLCSCSFVFDGLEFVQTKACWEVLEEESER